MELPIKVLAIVPQPTDAPWASAAAAAWTSIAAALRGAMEGGAIEVLPLRPATVTALEQCAGRERFNVVHVVSRATSRPAARYGTLTLEGSDSRARDFNARNFAKLCAGIPGLELVVLQQVGGTSTDLEVLGEAVRDHAASVVSGPSGAADSREAIEFARMFYTALATGQSIAEAFAIATGNPSALPGGGSAPGQAVLRLRAMPAAITGAPAPPPAAPRRVCVESTVPVGVVLVDDHASAAQQQVERKRAARAFDVFLCHNVGDKAAVMEIARRLTGQGILPWLDQWELRPGTPWQRVLEEQIANIRAAAVFVGREGVGPWQRQELDGFLREFNKRGCPVIPVLLPGASGEPDLPLFLRGMTWVDFRQNAPDPIAQLVWGITGNRPTDF